MDAATACLDLLERPTGKPPRKDSEVSTAADGDAKRAFRQDRDRVLLDLKITGNGMVGVDGRVRDSVAIVSNGDDATVVLDSVLKQFLDRPWVLLGNGEAGSSKVSHRLPGDFGQGIAGQLHVDIECHRALLIEQPVPIRMRADDVTRLIDTTNQVRELICHPAQYIAERLHPARLEHIEHRVGIVFHSRFPIEPALSRDERIEGRDLKVVFDIDAEDVARSGGGDHGSVSDESRVLGSDLSGKETRGESSYGRHGWTVDSTNWVLEQVLLVLNLQLNRTLFHEGLQVYLKNALRSDDANRSREILAV